MRYSYLLSFVLSTCAFSVLFAQNSITYITTKDHSLLAIINDKDSIELKKEECVYIEDIKDFDGDGLLDVLAMENLACGKCNGNNYHFFSYRGSNHFVYTQIFSGYYNQVSYVETIIDEKKALIFNIEDSYCADTSSYFDAWSETFVFEEGKAILRENKYCKEMLAIAEIRKEALSFVDRFIFDVDGDGVPDLFKLQRWGDFENISLEIYLDESVTKIYGNRRLGILNTKTNGVHDIVIDFDRVYVWNGKEYVQK